MESSFQISICKCPDIAASTMALDVTGRYALMSGRKAMCLVDLDADRAGSLAETASASSSSTGNQQSKVHEIRADNLTESTSSVANRPSINSRRIARASKYEPTASHFNRHMADLYALTTNQVIEVFSIDDLNPAKPKLTLRGHSRAIADLEWSEYDPYLLGSSAADCLTNLWDIRDSRRPSGSLTSVSGSTLVRFSKTSSNLLATCHEIDVRIWDIRQQNLPLYYIAAHLQKINGIDWNPSKTHSDHDQLITCSQDNTIKLWDLNGNKIKPSASFSTRNPAWRIRYTPVTSNAILTSTLPQLRSRTECMTLKLWSMKSQRIEQQHKLELIMGLVGHTDVIVDFDWRSRPSSSSGCEIVSWSKDQTLRVWRVDQQFIEMNVDNSDHEIDCETQDASSLAAGSLINIDDEDATASGLAPPTIGASDGGRLDGFHQSSPASPSNSGSDSSLVTKLSPVAVAQLKRSRDEMLASSPEVLGDDSFGSSSPQQAATPAQAPKDPVDNNSDDDSSITDSNANELKLEFSLINKNIPNLEFEELNSLRRVCLVTACVKTISCRLRIALPPGYPHQECPTFTILNSSQYGADILSRDTKDKLLALLDETAKLQLSRSRNCIEPCLHKFVAALQKITSHSSHRRRLAAPSAGLDLKDDPITLSAQRDHSIPFPRTSGARFCGNLLVIFGRPMLPTANTSSSSVRGGDSTNWLVETPRSLAQLSAHLDNMRRQGSYNLNHISISYFYYGAMRRNEIQNRSTGGPGLGASAATIITDGSSVLASSSASIAGHMIGSTPRLSSKYLSGRSKSSGLHSQPISKSYKCGPVLVYDVTDLFGGISRELAENYVFDRDVIKMCRRNAEVAASFNRKDLAQVWSLAELSSEGVIYSHGPNKSDDLFSLSQLDSDFGDRLWTMHPFGSKLIQSLIDHYVNNCHDVQTAAMLVWTFSSPKLTYVSSRAGGFGHTSSSPQDARQLTETSNRTIITTTPNSGTTTTNNTHNVSSQAGAARHTLQSLASVTAHYYTVMPSLLGASLSNSKRHANGAGHNATSQLVANIETISGEWNFVNTSESHLYSNSWSNSTIHENVMSVANLNGAATACDSPSISSAQNPFPKLNILDPQRGLQNDLIMHIYAELLYQLNLLNQRAMVLKNIGSHSAYCEIFARQQNQLQYQQRQRQHQHRQPALQRYSMGATSSASDDSPAAGARLANLLIRCHYCRNECQSAQCNACKRHSLYCAVCRLPVRGSCSVCTRCLHGGHVNHFNAWFSSYTFCPTGCGCQCLLLVD